MTVLDLPDSPGPTRDALILKHIVAGDAEVVWVPLTVSGNDRTIEVLVMQDALKLGGVRVGAGAGLAQQSADALGALLLTPKLLDLIYAARTVTIEPMTQYSATEMLTTHWFEKESARIDAAIASSGGVASGGIVQTVGKPWMITNALASHPGKACNYGWHVPPGSVVNNSWKSTPAYLSVTLPGVYVLQQPGFAHGLDEADYSEMILLAHRACKVDGAPSDLVNVLQDASLAPLVSHEGPLTVLRQPGVPVFSCPTAHPSVSFAVPADMCPTPAPPQNVEKTNWGLVALSGAAAAAVVFGFWAAMRYAGRSA